MPTSETGNSTDSHAPAPARAGRDSDGRNSRGFTLIELVVVMAIVSVLAVTASLGLGAGAILQPGGGPDRAARALADDVAAARDRALMGRRALGLVALSDGWQIVTRDDTGVGWRPIGPRGTAPAPLVWRVAGAAVPMPVAPDPAASPVPAVIFAADGRATPFSVRIGAGAAARDCATDGWETLQCRP